MAYGAGRAVLPEAPSVEGVVLALEAHGLIPPPAAAPPVDQLDHLQLLRHDRGDPFWSDHGPLHATYGTLRAAYGISRELYDDAVAWNATYRSWQHRMCPATEEQRQEIRGQELRRRLSAEVRDGITVELR